MDKRILQLLADGQFHSGEDLGEQLGVTRSAVWKSIQGLQALGVDLHIVRNRGYKIPGGVQLLDKELIYEAIGQEALAYLSDLKILDCVDSTNNYVLSKKDAQPGYVLLVEHQTAGRGRRGRTWISPFGANLYLSALWQFWGGSASLMGLSLAVGVAVIRAMRRYGIQGTKLKWPNDIIYEGKKLGGILIDMYGDAAGPCQAVIGIGIDVTMPADQEEKIDQQWIDIQQIIQGIPNRNQIAGLVIHELMLMLVQFQRHGTEAFYAEWQECDALQGEKVTIHMPNSQFMGIAKGIDQNGCLLVQGEQEMQVFSSAEVSVRYSK